MWIFKYDVNYPLPTMEQIDESNDDWLIWKERPLLSINTKNEVDSTKNITSQILYIDDDWFEFYIDWTPSLKLNNSYNSEINPGFIE